MLGVNYMRDNDSLLARLGVPKTSQFWKYFLYYITKMCIWFIKEFKVD